MAGGVTSSQPTEETGAPQPVEELPVCLGSTASTGRGASVVRPVVPLLAVREVAAEVAICWSTIYAHPGPVLEDLLAGGADAAGDHQCLALWQ